MTGRIYLIGFMGAGKSTVAHLLASRFAAPAYDLDRLVEEQAGMRVCEVFETLGEQRFREMETEALRATEHIETGVFACGGGVVVRDENRALLSRLGTIVYLTVSAEVALARIGDVASRPLLSGPSGALAATALLAAREGLYRSVADAVVTTEGRDPSEVAEAVVEALQAQEGTPWHIR